MEYLKECLEKIEAFCETYGIILNRKKTKICDLKHGFTYLKTRFFITESGISSKSHAEKRLQESEGNSRKMRNLCGTGYSRTKMSGHHMQVEREP